MLVAVALAVVIIPTTLSAMGLGTTVRGAVNIILSPAQKLFNKVTTALGGYSAYFTEFDRISEENGEMKAELNALREKIAKDDKLERDYEWLSRFIELKREHTDYSLLDCSVTGHESGNYITVLTVDRGTAHGVGEGMPVITEDGIVGSVVEVGATWAKVETVLNATVRLGGMIERTGETGLVSSDFIMTKIGECKMTFLPAESDVREGDRIMTSGYGSVYPRGLLVGTVMRAEPDPYSQSITAYIEPAVELKDLTRLMIITDYSVTLEDAYAAGDE